MNLFSNFTQQNFIHNAAECNCRKIIAGRAFVKYFGQIDDEFLQKQITLSNERRCFLHIIITYTLVELQLCTFA